MWQIKNGSWEYIAVDEPEGQIVIKGKKAENKTENEIVLIDAPEGQVVVKRGRKPKKSKNSI
jgi:hypothetical protein